ncbi:hypothetical protein DXN04_22165 [Chitinophaga silvisoli]|uniref:Uncharacterized protein n=1 Tax=Chitinophaga silvisoli TaxID=2291814 RepID=A0A3E1NWU0_9BACT|nr:hypothetical protein DXN04_22165 [Chitinophaga silvisoli]
MLNGKRLVNYGICFYMHLFLESVSIKVKEIWKSACLFITGFFILLVMALWNFKQQFQQDNSSPKDI